jgi:hypothetical protein
MDELILLEKTIRELTLQLTTTNNNFLHRKIQRKINKLSYDQETNIMNYLEQTDKAFIALLNQNFDLLQNNHVVFNVSIENNNFLYSYETELEGSIHDNGYIYYLTKKTNNFLKPFASLQYPQVYSGVINYLGESVVTVVEKKFCAFFARVPEKFIGSIDENGNVNFSPVTSFLDIDGHGYVEQIIGDPFSGNETKRNQFISNKTSLHKIISDFKQNLKV